MDIVKLRYMKEGIMVEGSFDHIFSLIVSSKEPPGEEVKKFVDDHIEKWNIFNPHAKVI